MPDNLKIRHCRRHNATYTTELCEECVKAAAGITEEEARLGACKKHIMHGEFLLYCPDCKAGLEGVRWQTAHRLDVYTQDTLDHIGKVQARMTEATANLMRRSGVHDASKLQEPERSGYMQMAARLKSAAYGSDEYKASLADAKPTIDHHYAHNSHHPEHHPNGISGMSLLDVLEMLCDWKAASERHGGRLEPSLLISKERFGISDQLYSILVNTARELGWIEHSD